MATQKPISTISYNTWEFLIEKLNDLVEAHIIQSYMAIKHKGEDGDKDHTHVRIEPNKRIDPMDLTEMLKEYEKGKDKPLGVRPWRPSKEEDWILYAVHDEKYLNLKYGGGEKGEKLPYTWEDIKVSDCFDMETAYIRAKAYLEHTTPNIINRMLNGESAVEMAKKGENLFTINNVCKLLYSQDTEAHENYSNLLEENKILKSNVNKLILELGKKGIIVKSDGNGGFEVEIDGK